MRIQLPYDLSAETVCEFATELHKSPDSSEYIFDFGQRRWFPPFSMLLLALEIKRFREERQHCRCRAENHIYHTYAAHMGFFKAFGLEYGNSPGEASGSNTYLPLSQLSVRQLHEEATAKKEHVGEAIERRSLELSKLLTREHRGSLLDSLTYSIRELMRNIVEHSNGNEIYYGAQYWPILRRVEVGIADRGRGIFSALSQNKKLKLQSDKQAVQVALLPGISGMSNRGRRSDDPAWRNSGYGLYMISRLCAVGGGSLICSKSSGVALNGQLRTELNTDFSGTAVRIEIDVDALSDLTSMLDKFRKEGKHIAGTVKR